MIKGTSNLDLSFNRKKGQEMGSRALRLLMGIAATASWPGQCLAQDNPFADWQYQQIGAGAESYVAPQNAALVMFVDAAQSNSATDDEAALLVRVAQLIEKSCQGLSLAARSAKRVSGMLRSMAVNGQVTCVALAGRGELGLHAAVIMAMPYALSSAEAKTRTVLSGRAGGPVASQALAGSPSAAQPSVSVDQSGLLGLLDKVPQAARPVTMVGRESWSGGFNGMLVFKVKPWALFSNGVAMHGECSIWDPMSGPPRPDFKTDDCKTERWRKDPSGYTFIASDGDVSKPQDVVATPFRSGEMVDLLLESSSTSGAGFSTDFSVGTSSTWQGRLQLTQAGQFRGSASSTAYASGAGVVAGANRRNPVITGTYALSGFLVAIQDSAGRVAIKLIGRKVESGREYAYFDGRLYWPDD